MQVHPDRMKWIVKRMAWVVVGLVAVLLVIAAIKYKQKSLIEALRIKIVETDDELKFIQEDDVRDILFNKFGHYLEGQTLEKIDVEATEAALEKDPFIEEADVYIDAQNRVNVSIEQREPILRVMDVEDKSYYLDEKGVDQIPLSSKYAARVLTATGDVGLFMGNYKEIEDNQLRKVYNIAMYISENEFWKAQIEQIHTEHNGDIVLIPKLGDHKIYFGDPETLMENKFKRLENFYKEALPHKGWDKYKTINLAYKDQVVCKKR
ncbi:MAG: cell division protein FtsQ [Aureispira sp.]|nr:cell division protein FtsQ [Aureispira sp.]